MKKQSKYKIKISKSRQWVAEDILKHVETLLMTNDKTIKYDDLYFLFIKYKKAYNLRIDPFVSLFCEKHLL